jgi:UDP-N-acetylmuramoylalanine--D-glutamate ligase
MQKISLFGHGLTTKALAKNIQHNNPDADIRFYDDKVAQSFQDKEGFLVCPTKDFDAQNSSLEIPSPGVPPLHPLIQKATNLFSEYDYFFNLMPFTVWISGTNGKTTTTQMLTYLLSTKGAKSGGNIGTPLGDMDTSAPLWVLETSSFTLHYTQKAAPNIYLLLPVTPDHLSWHGSFDAYAKDKLSPLLRMREGEIALLPKALQHMLPPHNATVLFYEDTQDLACTLGIDTAKIAFEGAFLLDALFALCVQKILFNRVDYETINTFRLDAHRQEEFFDARGRLWVNDTKATNLDATIAAMRRYRDKPVHLILGGDDKGVELTPLFDFLHSCNVTVYAIGSNEKKLLQLASQFHLTCKGCQKLEEAVRQIDLVLQNDAVALLSPAAASLDQFTSYAQRGELFKKLVQTLKKDSSD